MAGQVVCPRGVDGEATTASLVTLTTSVASIERLLRRLDVGGTLMQADTHLIRLAINTIRTEAHDVVELLKSLLRDANAAERAHVSKLCDAMSKIYEMIDGLDEALTKLRG